MRIAILASGTGSNLRTILEHAKSGALLAEPCLVLSNNPAALALDHAKKFNVPIWTKSHVGIPRESYDVELISAIKAAKAEAIILAGYMRLLSSTFFKEFSGPILNIHPSLLPAFTGAAALEQTLDYGVRFAGCSVHFVEEKVDSGPIIIQAALPISEKDNLESIRSNIQQLEHLIYPQAIKWLVEKRLVIEGRKVRVLSAPKTLPPKIHTDLPFPYLTSPSMEDF